MKRIQSIILLLVCMLCLAQYQYGQDPGYAGSDLTFEFLNTEPNGDIRYEFRATIIADCSANSEPPPTQLKFQAFSPKCTNTSNFVDFLPRVLIEPAPSICNTVQCGQVNPEILAYEVHHYEGEVVLEPCEEWVIPFFLFDRLNAITTGLGNETMMMVAILNNDDFPTNSSPSFNTLPFLTVCENTPFSIDHGITDPETNPLDLDYALVEPASDGLFDSSLEFVTVPAGYSSPFTFTNPFQGTFNLNSTNAITTGNPTQPDITNFALEITERDINGTLMCRIIRDFHLQIADCSNDAPNITGTTQFHNLCVGGQFTLNFGTADPEGDGITISNITSIPGLNVSILNNGGSNPTPTGTITWTPTTADIGSHQLSMTLTDDGCPSAQVVATFILIVKECCGPWELASCCDIEVEHGDNFLYPGGRVLDSALSYLNQSITLPNGGRGPDPGPEPGCDPCVDDGYPIWVVDENGQPVDFNDSDPCITIEWFDASGILVYTGWSFWANVDEDFSVVVTNTCENCSWTEDFTYTCCGVPENPSCNKHATSPDVLSWDPVPGATYEVEITINDPNCCQYPGLSFSFSIFTSNTNLPLMVSYLCASWRVRAICGNGEISDYTTSQCICKKPLLREGNVSTVEDYNVFPSPASSALHIQGENIKPGTELILTDMAGKTIVHKTVSIESDQFTIQTENITNGIYMLSIVNGKGVAYSQKVSIIH